MKSKWKIFLEKTKKYMRKNKIFDKTWSRALLAIISILWLLPIAWIIITSFRAEPGVATTTILPKSWTINNYKELFFPSGKNVYSIKFGKWFMNTLVIALLNAIISTLITISTAYSFSRFRFKSRKKLMNVALILGMFPGFMAMIAIYLLLNMLGLIGSPFALLIIYASGSGLGFYISKGYFDTISKSLDEAAQIDGASRARIFFSIILPLSKPIIIYTALTSFMAPWMDFILASMMLIDVDSKTVAVGLYGMITSNSNLYTNFTIFAAGCVVVSVPIVIFYACLQRYMISGIAAGAVKQ